MADCFAAGECCSDMTTSVELWKSLVPFEDCPAGTLPLTCEEAPNKVKIVLSLPFASAAEFTQAKRTQFRQGIANAAGSGVSVQDVVIKKVTEKARRRHLLAASIEVPPTL